MRQSEAATPFEAEQRKLQAMLDDGDPFPDLEAAIAGAPVTDDERAALWLACWALAKRRRYRPAAARPRSRPRGPVTLVGAPSDA